MEKQDEQYGIESLKIGVDFVVEVGNVIPEYSKAKNSPAKVFALRAIADELMALITLDLATLQKEWNDLSEQELDELFAHAEAKFSIENKDVEGVVKEALGIVRDQIKVAERAMGLSRKIQAMKAAA